MKYHCYYRIYLKYLLLLLCVENYKDRGKRVKMLEDACLHVFSNEDDQSILL